LQTWFEVEIDNLQAWFEVWTSIKLLEIVELVDFIGVSPPMKTIISWLWKKSL
jgi:hypothetical protein